MANVAALRLGDRDFLFATVGGLFERNLHVITQVVSALGLRRIASPAAKQVFENTCPTEDLSEHFEWIMEPSAASKPARPPIKSRMTILVVERALLLVAQDLVGLPQFLEFLLGCLVTRIFIRM